MKPLASVEEINDLEYFTTVLNTTKTAYNASVIALKTSIYHLNESSPTSSPSSTPSSSSSLSSSSLPSPGPTTPTHHGHEHVKAHKRTHSSAPCATLEQYSTLALQFLRDDQHLEERKGMEKLHRLSTKLTKSTSQKAREESAQQSARTCLCCCDTVVYLEYKVLDCGDVVCLPCLGQMILPSIKEEAKLPPRCCGIPMSSGIIAAALTDEQLHQFLQAVYVAITPVLCRVWCPKPTCSAFTALEPEYVQSNATISCWSCGTGICTSCKQYEHQGSEKCAVNLEPPAVLNMIYKYGWRQCIRCHCLLELKEGCRQVKCSCGANFCYVCMEPGQCKNACSLARLDRYRHQAEVARKRDADHLAAKDAQLASQAVQNPEFASLERQSRHELERFFEYYKQKLSHLHSRHEQHMSQTLAGSAVAAKSLRNADAEGATTYLETVIDRQQRILTSVDDFHVQQEAQLLQQQALKEAKLKQHVMRLQRHWNGVIISSQRHHSDLSEQLDGLTRLERRHALEIKSLRETQQRIQDELRERFAKEIKAAAETQQRREKRASNMIAREESIFNSTFQRRLESLWKLWALRWDEMRLQLRNSSETSQSVALYPRFRPSWLGDASSEMVRFAINELRAVLVVHYGKETVDRLTGSSAVAAGETVEPEEDKASMWEWEEDGDDEDIDYHDFVRPWKKARKTRTMERFDLGRDPVVFRPTTGAVV